MIINIFYLIFIDTYSLKPNSNKCLDCPPNFKCPGGSALILEKNYWRNKLSDIKAEKCIYRAENCIGGRGQGNILCKKGYVGANCEVCDLENKRGDGNFANVAPY